MSSAAIATQTTFERWTADPSRTTVEFEVGHMWGLHTVRGRFRRFDGAYVVGRGGSEIELTIDAGSVDTGCVARDKHLRSADFFDADQHPQVRFTSTRVTGLGSGRAHMSGELEAAGKRVPLAFDASVRLIDGDLELEATTTVDQSRFGMSDGPLSQRAAADDVAREDAPRQRALRVRRRPWRQRPRRAWQRDGSDARDSRIVKSNERRREWLRSTTSSSSSSRRQARRTRR